MRILHLSNTPLSNAPCNISGVLNFVGHQSKVLLGRRQNINKVFVGGALWSELHPEQIAAEIRNAHVLHYHNFADEQELFAVHPFLWEIAKRKPCVIQYHSPRDSSENFENTYRDKFFKGRRAVIAQYHTRHYPNAEFIVPNPLPLHHEPFCSPEYAGRWQDNPLLVSYAPSNTHLRGWDYKGFDQISPMLFQLAREGVSAADIIVGEAYHACLQRKSLSAIGIEEFFTGSYHLSFLEYLALGCCTFGRLDALTKKALAAVVGEDQVEALPHVEVSDADSLYNGVKYMCQNREQAQALGAAAKQWMQDNWSPEKTASHYVRMYESVIG